MTQIKIAFWNLQNLFDTTPSDIATDFGFTPDNGWTPEVFGQKLANLAAVIKLMHNGEKPDLLGFCEIENRSLVQQLMEAAGLENYEIAYVEGEDLRGIDTALIYSSAVFEPAGDPIGHIIHLRYPTRDIFQVPLRVKQNDAALTVLVNHWPSRSKGVYESEPFRLTVAEECGRIIDQLLKFPRTEFMALPDTETTLHALNDRWDANVLLMGDFNDEPFNRSLIEFLQASSGIDHVEEDIKSSKGSHKPAAAAYLGKKAYLFNCMWQRLGMADEGSYYFSESTNTMNMFDQFVVSRGILFGKKGLKINQESVEIFKPDIMSTSGKKRPKRFEFDKKGVKVSGYSDHFPAQACIEVN